MNDIFDNLILKSVYSPTVSILNLQTDQLSNPIIFGQVKFLAMNENLTPSESFEVWEKLKLWLDDGQITKLDHSLYKGYANLIQYLAFKSLLFMNSDVVENLFKSCLLSVLRDGLDVYDITDTYILVLSDDFDNNEKRQFGFL